MKKETTQKKIWQKPEVQDLDVKNTASHTKSIAGAEATSFSITGPAAS